LTGGTIVAKRRIPSSLCASISEFQVANRESKYVGSLV
jgi:hypothetical protein